MSIQIPGLEIARAQDLVDATRGNIDVTLMVV